MSSIGAALISFGLPVACYAFAFLCNDVSGCPAPALLHPSTLTRDTLKQQVAWPGVYGLINLESFAGTIAYYAFSLLLNTLLPGQEVDGIELKGGGRLKYRFNGMSLLDSAYLCSLTDFHQPFLLPSSSSASQPQAPLRRARISFSGLSSTETTWVC